MIDVVNTVNFASTIWSYRPAVELEAQVSQEMVTTIEHSEIVREVTHKGMVVDVYA